MKRNFYDKIPRDRLEAYLDGTLGDIETAEIDAMLDSDPELQQFVDDYINLQMTIANTKDEASDDSSVVDMEAVSEINKAIAKARKYDSGSNWKGLRWVACVVSLVAVGVAGYLIIFNQSGIPTEPGGAVRGGEGVFDKGIDYGAELLEIDSLIEVEKSELTTSDPNNSDFKEVYELKWKRIQLLKEMNDYGKLQGALEEFVTYPGRHKYEAEEMWFNYFED